MNASKLPLWFQGTCLLALVITGCGGDSSGNGASSQAVTETCMNLCNKEKSCNPQVAGDIDCNKMCTPASNGGGMGGFTGSPPPGCDASTVISKENACASGTCDALEHCITEATASCSGAGAGGSGGSTGAPPSTGGSSGIGTEDCSLCDKASTCCVGLAKFAGTDQSSCTSFSAASCSAVPASSQSQYIQTCQRVLTSGQSVNIAECK